MSNENLAGVKTCRAIEDCPHPQECGKAGGCERNDALRTCGLSAAPADHTHAEYADGFDDGKAQALATAVRVIARLLALDEHQSADATAEAERLLAAAGVGLPGAK